MIICPKCGSHRITNPKYETNFMGKEALRYTYINCGYSTITPTRDNKDKE